ncbi:MAG: PepSY-associated TM helix domain-containing protein [Caulobacteraceae bacterium]
MTAWLDPRTGRLLDVGAPRQELRGFIHQLHGNLFMAQPGRKLVGWLGLFMLVSCVSGLVIWWPKGAFLKGLAWRRSPTAWSNLHHLVGFWICAPLALLSFTGAAIAFPEVVRLVSGAPAPAQGLRDGGDAVVAEPRLSVDAAVTAALAAAGPGRVQQVALPASGQRPAWRVQLRGDRGAMQVRVDDQTGEAEARPAPPPGPGGGDPLMRLMRQVHDGDDTSPLWRVIIAAAGLAPGLLGVTGTVLWFRRRRPAGE